MAIWQHKLFVLPSEEYESFFSKQKGREFKLSDIDGIDWWKYSDLKISNFEFFKNILKVNKSWSDSIIQYGELDSNCIEILNEEGRLVEVSVRVDLRNFENVFLDNLINFLLSNELVMVSANREGLNVFYPSKLNLKKELINANEYFNSLVTFLKKSK